MGHYDAMRRCCEPGCTAQQAGGAYAAGGWYRVRRGFMLHACPAHADRWRQADRDAHEAERRRGEAYERGCRWVEAMACQAWPLGEMPDHQDSVVD